MKKTKLCKKCKTPITWVYFGNRWHCYNAGTEDDHWDTCSTVTTKIVQQNGVKKIKSDGSWGYVYLGKFHKMQSGETKMKAGKFYKPDKCTCGLPPWELCKPDCKCALTALMKYMPSE